MAQATNEPTAPAAEAHPDLRKIVYDAEDDLHCACDYVQSAAMMVEGRGPISEKKRSAVIRLISDAHDKMKIVREAWRALHEVMRRGPAPAPAAPTREREAHRAAPSLESGFDLEGAIADLRNATIVLETMAEDAIGTRGGWAEQHIKKAVPGIEDYHIFILTEDQASGLDYILHHVGNLARALHSSYFGEDEAGGPVDDGNGEVEEAEGDAS